MYVCAWLVLAGTCWNISSFAHEQFYDPHAELGLSSSVTDPKVINKAFRTLSLDFHPFESGVLLLTVLLVGFLVQNGESNWLQGVMLVTAYLVVSAGFFVHVDPVVPPAA